MVGVPVNANPVCSGFIYPPLAVANRFQDGGDNIGVYGIRRSVDIDTGRRVHAASAYYTPIADRPNLKILCNAQV